MPTFGHYETIKQLHRTGFSAVFLGRNPADPASTVAIKVYKPTVRVHDASGSSVRKNDFLNSAALQQKAADADATSWARIYDYGTSPEGEFYVTESFPCSAGHLIDGMAKTRPADLYAIMSNVLHGLLTLQQTGKRAHANLKPSNVLISKPGRIADARIVLCDPLDENLPDQDTPVQTDLRNMGEMIHQLVTHQPTASMKGWQAPESDHWKRLGKRAQDWRALCNLLLRVDIEPHVTTLPQLRDTLETLKPKQSFIQHLFG